MRYQRVAVLPLPGGTFFVSVPVNGNGKEFRQFQKEFVIMVKRIEPSVEPSKVRRRMGIYIFGIATDLNTGEIEALANQALKVIKQKRRQK